MKKPQMIFFDYGGTLFSESVYDFKQGEKEVFKHVVKNPYHVTSDEVSQFETDYFDSLQGIRDLDFEPHEYQMLRYKYEYFGIELDIPIEEAESLLWDYTCSLKENLVMPNLKETLEFLKENQIRTAVISNMGWSQKSLTKRIERMLPDHEFEFILASSEYGLRKPDPRIFELALRKAHLAPEDAWYIGDTFSKDVCGAFSVGMPAYLYMGTSEKGPQRSKEIPQSEIHYGIIHDYLELQEIIRRCEYISY